VPIDPRNQSCIQNRNENEGLKTFLPEAWEVLKKKNFGRVAEEIIFGYPKGFLCSARFLDLHQE
jgi:hypothetical protein